MGSEPMLRGSSPLPGRRRPPLPPGVRVLLRGEQFHRSSYQGVQILISREHPHRSELRARLQALVRASHPRLRAHLRWLVLPFDTVDGVEPGSRGTIPASALAECGLLIFWGRAHARHGYCTLNLMIFEHELAHLAGCKSGPHAMGPPPALLEAWSGARPADAAHQQRLGAAPRAFQQSLQLEGVRRAEFCWAGEWLTRRVAEEAAERREMEDWAESVECYCRQRREGELWAEEGERVDFTECWPHRSQILEGWLAASPVEK